MKMQNFRPLSLFCNEYTQTTRLIYTPSNFARLSLQYIQEVGELKALRSHRTKRSGLESYLFFVVTSGNGSVTYDDSSVIVSSGDCVFIDCSHTYSQCSSDDNPWSMKWVHFSGETMPLIYQKYLERGGSFVFTPTDVRRYEKLLGNVMETANSESYVKDMELASHLTKLLTYLMEDAWECKKDVVRIREKRKNMTEIHNYIEENYTEKLSLEELASRFYIEKSYLAKVFKAEYGMTVNNYILYIRVTKAKKLLRFSENTIEVIAQKVGVNDPNYFTRIFKKVEGMSPGEYRKKWKTLT